MLSDWYNRSRGGHCAPDEPDDYFVFRIYWDMLRHAG
jgi:hypothetical protein